jgi:hypothetical protein
MLIRVGLTLLALSLVPQTTGHRVLLLSLDGLGHQRLTEDPVAQELTTVQGLLRTGAHAEGLVPAFPSTTANGHAALWTGTYAGRNGILYNSTPALPRSAHRFTDRVVGFRSESLTAEPIWLTAARQQVPVVAHQVTQAYPFLPQTVGASALPGLLVANGFQSRNFGRWRVVRSTDQDVHRTSCEAWAGRARGARTCYEWRLGGAAGEQRLRAAALRDRMLIALSPAAGAVEVTQRPTETEPPRRRALARHWSLPLPVEGLPDGAPASLVFRLLELDPEAGSFLVLQSPLQETAIYASPDATIARKLVEETGPMLGNGASSLYAAGSLGAPAAAGGDGEAERRYLETLELVVRQQIAQSIWLFRQRKPRLHISYLSTADEIDHAWYGLDRSGDRRYAEFRRWGYATIEHAARAFASLASPGDHVIVTSDHGMAPVRSLFGVDAALAKAGLGGLAVAVNTCILLNTTDWRDGAIAPLERQGMIERVRRALLEARTPANGPIVTKIYSSREEMASFGHDGPGGADLCFDLADGVGVTQSVKADIFSAAHPPRGAHGFDPARADMKAILLIRGRRAAAGTSLGTVQSAAVAPLVADLLGIAPPRDSTFTSPLTRGRPDREPSPHRIHPRVR